MFLKIRNFLRRSARTTGFKLAAWYAGFFLAGSLCVLGLAYFLLASSLRREDRSDITARFRELSLEYGSNGLKNLKSAAWQAADGGNGTFYLRIFAKDGTVVYLSGADSYARFAPAAAGLPLIGEAPRWDFISAGGDEDVLELLSGRLPDGAVLQVGMDTADRENFLENFQNIALVVMVPAMLLALIGGTFLTNRALKPLRNLIETVRTIETGNLAARVQVRGAADELDEAGALFNRMLDKISALVSGMREALDNVAHDLRTPMARLRAVAETALSGKTTAETRGEALSDCLEETERVITLLDALMEISEAEAGVMKLNCEPVRLAEVAAEVGEIYGYPAEAKGIGISVRIGSDVKISCDRARVRQALGNLADNAVKYSPPGSAVSISLAEEDGAAVFRVRDQGPGIPAGDIPRIWDRLYRGDASRHEKGLGLGLSLVRAVAQAHGGAAAVESKPGEGSVFVLRIPAADGGR